MAEAEELRHEKEALSCRSIRHAGTQGDRTRRKSLLTEAFPGGSVGARGSGPNTGMQGHDRRAHHLKTQNLNTSKETETTIPWRNPILEV